jgi:hypothetical protein
MPRKALEVAPLAALANDPAAKASTTGLSAASLRGCEL